MKVAFASLIAAWRDLRTASRAMRDGPVPTWPWDRTSPEFIENQRLRDRTQGIGMRFAYVWREHAMDILSMVEAFDDVFARYHVVDDKGERVDPTQYMESMRIMPVLIEMAEKEEDA